MKKRFLDFLEICCVRNTTLEVRKIHPRASVFIVIIFVYSLLVRILQIGSGYVKNMLMTCYQAGSDLQYSRQNMDTIGEKNE